MTLFENAMTYPPKDLKMNNTVLCCKLKRPIENQLEVCTPEITQSNGIT